MKSEVTQSCLTLCDPVDCSPPGSSLHGILQARILEWVAISFSRGSSWPRDQTQVSCIAGRRFNLWATREAQSPVLNPCGLNSQIPLTSSRNWSYRFPWNVHMLLWCWDLGKIQSDDLQHWHSFMFSSYFHAGVDLFTPLSSPARASPALLILQTPSLSHLVIPSVSTLQFTPHEYQVADVILPNSKYSGKSFTGAPQSVNIWSV